LPPITEQVCPHRLPQSMYAVLAEESLTRLCSNRVNNGWQRLSLSQCTPTYF